MIDTRSVDERLSKGTPVDQSRAHDFIAAGMRKLADRLYAAFPVKPHPMSEKYTRFASAGEVLRGEVHAYTGEPHLEWVIDSWIGSPERGFTNHHLTIWLPPTSPVPHLGIAMGTIPDLFFFCDLVPRGDLWVDLAQLDRYHAPLNDLHMEVAAEARLAPFVSREPYIRQAISPVGVCRQGAVTEENIARGFEVIGRFMDRWIPWVKEAPPVPESERAALGARDRLVRKNIVERDPANIVAEKVLGPEITRDLVRILGRIES